MELFQQKDTVSAIIYLNFICTDTLLFLRIFFSSILRHCLNNSN